MVYSEQETRLRELENLHKTMTPEERSFIEERGFKVVLGEPPDKLKKPYIIMSTGEPMSLCHTYEGGGPTTPFNINPRNQSPESLAGLVEEMALKLLKTTGDSTYRQSLPEEGILIYFQGSPWEPTLRILSERYD